ncbi:Odorant receptor [Nesidiocoris tenuis]|uniref:Odorant receptor n=1 Tax=Nesidiocoris tenuis TaxID=355587 RepID=A0ABN7AWP4_9HEMI|nr:Odorant receptor [Nesidiocoris tenuis]
MDSWVDEYADKAMVDLYGIFLKLSVLVLDLSPSYAALSIIGVVMSAIGLFSISVMLTISAYKMSDDFEDFSGEANLGFLSILSFIFVCNQNYYRRELILLHHMIGKGFHDYKEPQYSPEELEKYKQYLNKLYLALMILACYVVFIALLVIFICPYIDRQLGFGWDDAYDQYGVNRQLPVPLWTPFASDSGLGYWSTLVLIECFGGAMFTLSIGGTALLFTGISGGILLEQKLLILSIQNLDKRAKRRYKMLVGADEVNKNKFGEDPLYQKCIEYCLQQNVIHHHCILRYYEVYQQVGTVPLLASFAIETIAIAMSMIRLNEGSAKWGANIAFGCIAIAEMANMIMLCVLGEQTTTLGLDMNQSLYFSKWYRFNKKNRMILLQFLIETRNPLRVGSLGLVGCNMEQFSQVMNSAYSFFNLLKVSKARD